jgi:exopolyphosphatase/guanosine-5'-triphosphate,3'-diphosphate pyrophosphatase
MAETLAPVDNEALAGKDTELLAAIDMGSNSFHLIIARFNHGELRPVETLAERVQLGLGLVRSRLTQEAIDRGLDCLRRFKQVIDSLGPSRIRVVGTNALRQAKNRRAFTEPAEQILGVPVDVIYGQEEARLIYLGVAHTLADDEHSRLVIDIGGGSTEFVVGQRFEPQKLQSLQLGCVSFTDEFFADGLLNKRNFRAAYDQAMGEISHIRRRFGSKHWHECVGSSGTLQAIELLVGLGGWRESGIDRKSLDKLRKQLLNFGRIDAIDIPELNEKRRGVIPAGVAIATAIFDSLNIETMRVSSGALREGVLYDLMGRLSHEDVRERSVRAMISRYGADPQIADLVADRVRYLADAAAKPWRLSDDDIDQLCWAARCHEIGVAIAQKHYNRHSAYLLRFSDMPGFSQREQERMAVLVRGHRGKIKEEIFDDVSEREREKVQRLMALLRLAVLFKHVESLEALPAFSIEVSGDTYTMTFPDGWRDTHPLTAWELKQNRSAFRRLGITLNLK